MGVMLSAGGAIRWLRDSLAGGRELSYRELDELAAESQPGARGLVFLPYLTGERTPILDPGARGVLSGLSLAHGRGDLMRAVIEGVCFGLKGNLELIESRGLRVSEVRVIGGGARSPLYLQILSDVLQRALVPLAADEGPALGAALLAAVGAGVFPSVEEACRAAVRVKAPLAPNPAHASGYARHYERFQDVYRRLKGSFVNE
jgi:xylulokinase